MKVELPYEFRPVVGQEFTEPSITQPDLAYSIRQLVTDYSVGQLPSLSQLQQYIDDDDDESMNGEHDLRFADKADALEKFLDANKLRRSIFERVKKQQEFKAKQNADMVAKYREKFGDLGEVISTVDPPPPVGDK